jgi:hypothetical protein
MKRMFFTFLIVLLAGLSNNVRAVEWRFDHPHTNIGFSITHLVISDVTGRFTEFDGTFSSPGDGFEGSQVSITIKTASIDTDNEKRDKHLRSADFFDAEKHPEITFKSTSFENVGDKKYDQKVKSVTCGRSECLALMDFKIFFNQRYFSAFLQLPAISDVNAIPGGWRFLLQHLFHFFFIQHDQFNFLGNEICLPRQT